MVTYEEFLKENSEIKELKYIKFGKSKVSSYEKSYKVAIEGNPKEYLDIADKATSLQGIDIDVVQTKESMEGIREFVKHCREDVKISNSIGKCNKEEFFNGEEIIESVVKEINPEWTAKQKLAYVHYKMGELVSYLTDYNFNNVVPYPDAITDSRNIWKGLATKQAVCNGITAIQRNILSRVGVETQELSSGTHSFMLTRTEDGNVITDATWDLAYTYYGIRPQHFGLSYENFRQKDGNVSRAHKLENPPENVITIEDEELRNIYQSIGSIGPDRKFNSKLPLITGNLNTQYPANLNDRITGLMEAFNTEHKDKLSHLEEFKTILVTALSFIHANIDNEHLFQQCIYSKEDSNFTNPKLITKIIGENQENFMYILDPKSKSLEQTSLEELRDKYNYHKNNTLEPFWNKEIDKETSEISRNDVTKE